MQLLSAQRHEVGKHKAIFTFLITSIKNGKL
jgi:hypothetical protein